MWETSQYQLLDFGSGRKLEQFGSIVVDRPCPAAEGERWSHPEWRSRSQLTFDESVGAGWKWKAKPPEDWAIHFESMVFQLEPTPFGHLGVFPEQFANWRWCRTLVASAANEVRGLNLFGYTGGTTLAMAMAGAKMVHIDASKPAVAWARRNAAASGAEKLPIRWIVEDAVRFVQRELKRGNRYELIALDPPSYGHGPDGQAWHWERDLEGLLRDCFALLSDDPLGILLTGHSDDQSKVESNIDRVQLELARAKRDRREWDWAFERSLVTSRSQRSLDFGYSVRWKARKPVDRNRSS